jgi:hypothetical protein
MLTRFPILDFLRSRTGVYRDAEEKVTVVLDSCGYGFTLKASELGKRSSLSGVFGVAGSNLELHALVGLPNVICFVWPHEFRELIGATELEMPLHSRDLDASVLLHFVPGGLRYGLVAGKQAKVIHELRRA